MAAETIKSCDLPGEVAANLFAMLNPEEVTLQTNHDPVYIRVYAIITDTEPKKLVYPEGWYYAKGNFRNKHQSTTFRYSEIRMIKSNGEPWKHSAKYCTAD